MHSQSLTMILAVALSASTGGAAEGALNHESAAELHGRARAKMRNIEYELAVPLLERALNATEEGPLRGELNADLGICYANLGDTARAKAAFEQALDANMLLDLPVGVSPKIRQLYERVRADRAAAAEAARMARHAAAVAPATAVAHSTPVPEGSGIKPVDVVLVGLMVAAAGGGIVTGVLSTNAANELQSGLHDRATVDSLDARRRLFGIASVSAYALAGAAAVVELALMLFLDRRPTPPSPAAVSLGLVPGGAAASLSIHF